MTIGPRKQDPLSLLPVQSSTGKDQSVGPSRSTRIWPGARKLIVLVWVGWGVTLPGCSKLWVAWVLCFVTAQLRPKLLRSVLLWWLVLTIDSIMFVLNLMLS
ncbi:hypothetical protein ACFX19_026071 [Malus domestica]